LNRPQLRREIRELGGRTASGHDVDAQAPVLGSPQEPGPTGRIEDDRRAPIRSMREEISEIFSDEPLPQSSPTKRSPDFAPPTMRRLMAGIKRQASVRATDDAAEAGTGEDIWHRVRITDDLEIHYREDTAEDRTRMIRKLIARARKLFPG
jgi:hypothetical protein